MNYEGKTKEDNHLKIPDIFNFSKITKESILKKNIDKFYKNENVNKDDYLIEKINRKNDEDLLQRDMILGNLTKKYGINKMKQKFDERKTKSVVKNKTSDIFRTLTKNFTKRVSSKDIIHLNTIPSINTKTYLRKNTVNYESNFQITNNSNNISENNHDLYFDSPNFNNDNSKFKKTPEKLYSMIDIKKNNLNCYSSQNSFSPPISNINGIIPKNSKNHLESIKFIQRNNTENLFFKSNNNIYDNMNSKTSFDINNKFNIDEYFNLMANYHNEENPTDHNILNIYLKKKLIENSLNSQDGNSQKIFYQSPLKNKSDVVNNINNLRSLEILKKLAFKEEPRRIIYETAEN